MQHKNACTFSGSKHTQSHFRYENKLYSNKVYTQFRHGDLLTHYIARGSKYIKQANITKTMLFIKKKKL
jgi:hypothetical protein